MSSRQQFLKGPGETGGDYDSDVQDSQGDVNDNYPHRLLNINQTQNDVLNKDLVSKKAKQNTDINEKPETMNSGLVIKKQKGLEYLNNQNKMTGNDSPRSDAQLVKRIASIKTEGNDKKSQNYQQPNSHQDFKNNQKDGVNLKSIIKSNDFQHDKNNKKRSFIVSEDKAINDKNYMSINDNRAYTLHKSNTVKLKGNANDLQLAKHVVETNIDPNIINNYEEEKELDRYSHANNNKPSQFKNNNKNIQFEMQNQKDNDDYNYDADNGNKSNNSKGNLPSDLASQKIINLLKSKKTDLFSQAVEDEEILNIELDLNEEPVTQGSVDQAVEIVESKEEFFIIHHSGLFRIRWDLWIILLVLYNCIQIPLEMAFQDQFENVGIVAFGYIVDCFFVCDIFFNFRTTFINDKTGLEVTQGKEIAVSYLWQWRFYFDLLSVIPFELLYNATNPNGSTNTTQFKVFDLLKLVRLLRLGRIITYLKFKQNIKIGFRIVQLLSMLLLIVHWIACIWFVIIDGSDWMPPRDANYGESDFFDESMGRQYAVLYYYAILLLLGSDILPLEPVQTVYAALVVILGSIMTAFIFGNMAALMAAMNQKDSQFQDQFDAITNLMRAIKLPVKTQREVEAYLLHIQQVPDMQQDMKTFLKLLSPSLRSSILFHIYRSIIKKIPIFDSCSNIELRFIVNYMKTVIFLPQDEITRQGDKGTKIYFISRGKVEIYIGPDETDVNEYELKRLNTNGSRKSFGKSFGGSLKSQPLTTPIAAISIGMLGENNSLNNISNNNVGPNDTSLQIVKKSTFGNTINNKTPSEFQNSSLNDAQINNMLQVPQNVNGVQSNQTNKDEMNNSTGAKSPRGSKSGGSVKGSKNGSAKGSKSGSVRGGKSSHSSEGLPQINQQKKIRELTEGEYFGEIALISNLKRTATVKAKDFTTLGYLMQRNFIASKDEFPQIYQAFKSNIKLRYTDENFLFRQKMIRNVPYFRKMSEAVIQELVYLLRPTRYDSNMLVVKRGDSTDKIYFLKAGVVDVEVPLKEDKMHFDSLNAGSCFCIFSAFHDDRKQKFDFRTKTVCVVESIAAKDIIALQKQYLELSDELKTLMVQIENNEKSEFDFFRYIPFRSETKVGRSEEWKANVRRKFRMAIAKFFRRMKKAKPVLTLLKLNKNANEQMKRQQLINHIFNRENLSSDEENDDRKHFKALHALDQLEKERKNKEQKLKMLKDRISNPSLFVISSLMGKKIDKSLAAVSNDDNLGDGDLDDDEPQVIIEGDQNDSVDAGDVLLTLDDKPNTPYNIEVDTVRNVSKKKKINSKNKDFDETEDYIEIPLVTDEQNIEDPLQKYPKIDGIRKDLKRFRDEQLPFNTEEINEVSVINNLSVLHQPGAVIENNGEHQDFTTLVGNYNTLNRPANNKISQNTQQNTFNSTHYNNVQLNAFKNDLQINILQDQRTPMNMYNNSNPNVITESSQGNGASGKPPNIPGWKQKLNMLKDELFSQKVKNQPIGQQNIESEASNKKQILSIPIKDKIQSSQNTNFNAIQNNIIETPINKNNFNSLTSRNPLNIQQKEQIDTNRSPSHVRFAHQNNFNSITYSDNMSQMIDRVDTLGGTYNNNNTYGSRQLKTIKEEDKQDGEDLIKVLTQINTSLQVQQQSMNTLQFDMLKRMVNLEKKLNRAMKIDIAANNLKNKPELLQSSPNNYQLKIRKNITHAEEIKNQLTTGTNGVSQRIKFKEPNSATQQNHFKTNSNVIGVSKETSLVTSIKDDSMNRIRFLDKDNNQSDQINFSSSKKSKQQSIIKIESQIASRQESSVNHRQQSTIMQCAKHSSGVSKGLESPNSLNKKHGEDILDNMVVIQDQQIQQQNQDNFLQVNTKLNSIAKNNNLIQNPDLMNSQYKYPNTPYFMTEYNDQSILDATSGIQQLQNQRQQQNLLTPPSRRSQADSSNTEVKEQAFTGPSVGSNQFNMGNNVQRNQAISQYQRHKNIHKMAQLPQIQITSQVDNSMKKMMVEDSLEEDEMIDISNARGRNNNLNQANLIDSQENSDQTLVLDEQFFDNPNANDINQNYLETEKLPEYFTPEYLLVTANNKEGQQSSQLIQPQFRNQSQNIENYRKSQQQQQQQHQQQVSHQSPHHQQQISQQSQQQLTSGQQTPQVIYELRIDNLKLKENQQVNELNIIWLPNSIVQFQGGNTNKIVEQAKKQQQEQNQTHNSNRDTQHRKQSSKSTTRNLHNKQPSQQMNIAQQIKQTK